MSSRYIDKKYITEMRPRWNDQVEIRKNRTLLTGSTPLKRGILPVSCLSSAEGPLLVASAEQIGSRTDCLSGMPSQHTNPSICYKRSDSMAVRH